MKRFLFAVLAVGLAETGCLGPSHYEQQADAVTRAIIANDMRPVEGDFNALVRPKLESHARVGALADQLDALGAFKGVKEDTPSDAPPRAHKFLARFAQATWIECMTYDEDGKIASFDVLPPGRHCPRM